VTAWVSRGPDRIRSVQGGESGPTVGVNYGTVASTILTGNVTGLADVVLDPSLVPLELGLTVGDEPVGGFTGRDWLIEAIDARIAQVIARPVGGYVLVEAEAGLGKSALMTYLAFSPTRGWPAHFSRLSTSPESARANLAAQITYLHTSPDSVDRLAGLPGNYTDPAWFSKRLITIQAQRRARGEAAPLIILVDGLDEAPLPEAGEVAFGLPRTLPAGVVVVATTRPGHPLPAGARVERINVTSQANLDDLRAHVTARACIDRTLIARLAASNVTPKAFARGLLSAAGGVWIYALSVIEQVCDGDLPADQLNTLPPGLAGYYSQNLRRIRDRNPDMWDAVVLPILGTLAAVAEPLTSITIAAWSGGLSLSPVLDSLDGPLRPFLAHTRDEIGDADPTGWYRLRHQSLRDFLAGRETGHEDHTVVQHSARCAHATRQAHARILAHITPALKASGIRAWADASDYARLHLIDHAVAAGQLDPLVLDPHFLLWSPLPPLLRARKALTHPQARQAIAARELTGDISTLPPDEQLRWLHVWALKHRSATLATSCAAWFPANQPRAHGAFWRGSAHTQLHGHIGPVFALGTWTRPDGTDLLVTAGNDRVVRLWDPHVLEPAGRLHGHTGPVFALGTWTRPDGTDLLVTAGNDRVVRLWDPRTLERAGELPHAHTNPVNAVGTWIQPDGTTLLVTAGNDRVVRLWNPHTLNSAGELPHAHIGPVFALGTWTQPDGTTLLATAGNDRAVRLWNPYTLNPAGELPHAHIGPVFAVGTWVQPDGTTLLVTASHHRAVRLWNPHTLNSAGGLHGHTGPVIAVGTWTQPDGTTLLVTAGRDDEGVWLWDPHTRKPVDSLHGHTGPVNAVGTWTQPDGTTLLVTAGRDDEGIWLWDPHTRNPAGRLHGHTGPVNAVGSWTQPDSTTLLATAGNDRVVRLWDPHTLNPAGRLQGHTGPVNAVGTWTQPDGSTLLVTAGRDACVLTWTALAPH
jgi:WD40 repeat protein